MSLQPIEHSYNQFSSLAWATSVALLGIAKLAQKKEITHDQRLAITEVMSKTKLLRLESKLSPEDFLNGNLVSERVLADPPLLVVGSSKEGLSNSISQKQLDEAVDDLEYIVEQIDKAKTTKIDSNRIEKTRYFCLNLLTILNSKPHADEITSRAEMG